MISPAPATFHTDTRLKYGFPVIVNRIPPCLLHGTLHLSFQSQFTLPCKATIYMCVYISTHSEIEEGQIKNVWAPAVIDRDNATFVLGHFKISRFCQIEVLAGRVAPSSTVTWLIEVGRTKVGGCHKKWGLDMLTPWWVHTLDLITCTTCLSFLEQNLAQCCCLHPISFLLYILVPTCSSCNVILKLLYINSPSHTTYIDIYMITSNNIIRLSDI